MVSGESNMVRGEGNMAVIHKWKIPAISQQVRGICEQGIQCLRGLKV